MPLFVVLRVGLAEDSASDSRRAGRIHWDSGSDGRGIEFDGKNFVTFEIARDQRAGPFTIAVWVNAFDLQAADPNYGRGIARSTTNGGIGDWVLAIQRDGRVRFINWRVAGTDTRGSHITVRPVIGIDYWYHIVAVWDGEANRIYVNGVLQEHADATSAANWGAGNEIGRSWTDGAYHWQGKLENFDLFGRALSADEIRTSFESNPKSQPRPKRRSESAGDPSITAAVDRLIQVKLKEHSVTAAPPARDAEFHRRVMLDLAGRIPTPRETRAFLAAAAPSKRHDLIDLVLSSREFPIYWSRVLANWLTIDGTKPSEAFVGYLRRGLEQNKPWNQFARDMLLARPSREDHHATIFLSSRINQIKDRTIGVDIGRAFFGVNLRCAQCHDHPSVPEWRLDHTYGLAAFFGRSYAATYKDPGQQVVQAIGELAAGEVEYTPVGESKQPAKLMFLDGTVAAEPPPEDGTSASFIKPADKQPVELKTPPPLPAFSRRAAFVKIALDAERPYFKGAIVNRVWQKLMGRGFVEPVDMIYADNPPSHPELFQQLSDDFAAHGFDLRRLIAVVIKSNVYARSSRWSDNMRPDESLYAAAVMKPLDAQQLAISLPMAAGHYDDRLHVAAHAGMGHFRPTKAWTKILDQFDAPGEMETDTSQALFLLNSEYLHEQVLNNNRSTGSLSEDRGEFAERVYLKILSRFPSDTETRALADYLATRGSTTNAAASQEITWALLTSAEFRFNH